MKFNHTLAAGLLVVAGAVSAGDIVDVARCTFKAAEENPVPALRHKAQKLCYDLLPANIRKDLYNARNDTGSFAEKLRIEITIDARCGPRSPSVVSGGSGLCANGPQRTTAPRSH